MDDSGLHVSFNFRNNLPWNLQQLLMWILSQWTATSLLLLAYNQTQRRILSIFRVLHLPQYWTFEWWSQTNVVYMRLHWIGEFYIGSTETTVFLREKSRTHKYKQHVSQQLAFFEPAIKLWCKRDNFYQFCIFSCSFSTWGRWTSLEPGTSFTTNIAAYLQLALDQPSIETLSNWKDTFWFHIG